MKKFLAGFYAALQKMHLNRVLITSLIFSLALVVQEMASKEDQSIKAYVLAIAIAALGFLSNTWKAKGLTLAGQLVAAVPALLERANGEPLSWPQLIFTLLLAFAAAYMGSTPDTGAPVENTGESTPNDAPNF